MSTTIEDRLILLLREDCSVYGFWQGLEDRTGISAQRWRKAYARRQRPTPDMIEALGKLHPNYAFWLITGITDAQNGHSAPSTALNFPELPVQHVESLWANEYFRLSLALNKRLYLEAKVNLENDEERLKAAERVMVGARWWGSNLVDHAYRITESQEYAQLKKSHEAREQNRESHLKKIASPSKYADPVPIQDPRTAHQGIRDLFWKSKERPLTDGAKED